MGVRDRERERCKMCELPCLCMLGAVHQKLRAPTRFNPKDLKNAAGSSCDESL